MRELRRVTSAQTREWAASQGEAVRLLSEEKTVVEARLAALTSEHERLTAMCDKLCACDQVRGHRF